MKVEFVAAPKYKVVPLNSLNPGDLFRRQGHLVDDVLMVLTGSEPFFPGAIRFAHVGSTLSCNNRNVDGLTPTTLVHPVKGHLVIEEEQC